MNQQSATTDPVLPEVKMNLVKPGTPCIGRVVSNNSCLKSKSNAFVRHTAIDVSDTPLKGNFLAGQSIGVIAPGMDQHGKPHKVRLYSVACPSWGEDGEGRIVSTTPKRLIDEFSPQKPVDNPEAHQLVLGVCSNYLCDLCPGDEVKLTGPSGKRFLLPVDPAKHDYLFIATGTGIAPFRAMALELLEHPNGPIQSTIHLLMGTPYTSDLLYDDLFTRLDSEHEHFHYHTAISREPRPGSSRGIYVDRLIDENLDQLKPLLKSPRTLIYMCGLLGMEAGVYRALIEHNLADPFIKIGDELSQAKPNTWTNKQVKRYLHATRRCIVEVY